MASLDSFWKKKSFCSGSQTIRSHALHLHVASFSMLVVVILLTNITKISLKTFFLSTILKFSQGQNKFLNNLTLQFFVTKKKPNFLEKNLMQINFFMNHFFRISPYQEEKLKNLSSKNDKSSYYLIRLLQDRLKKCNVIFFLEIWRRIILYGNNFFVPSTITKKNVKNLLMYNNYSMSHVLSRFVVEW